MTDVVLTIVDTAGIQDYVFGSNRLRENIGASHLVKQMTREWVYETLPQPNNIISGILDPQKQIETHDLSAELIYTGGGNALVLFSSLDNAKVFARELSRKVATEAPGLEIVIVHSQPFDWSAGAKHLPAEVKKLHDGRLAEKKHTRQGVLTPLLGLGVTAECAATGLVAGHLIKDPNPRFVSDEIAAKSRASDTVKERLKRDFAQADPQRRFDFSDELDHLSRTGGEESYIAVVHIDGNDVGSLFIECGMKASDNRDYIDHLRRLSAAIKDASEMALVQTLKHLAKHITKRQKKVDEEEDAWELNEAPPGFWANDQRDKAPGKRIRLYMENKEKNPNRKPYWPLIPLVYGGDDLTFVCNGQLGLSLAVICMKAFTALTEKLLGQAIHVGAGICIVKVHYPFRRAYELSESLTRGVKKMLGAERRRASGLDWHISTTGLSGSLSAIRAREYKVRSGSLLMRPVRLSDENDWRTWENFNRLVAEFNFAEQWAGRRNKLKSLREALRKGKDAVEEFRKSYFQNDQLSLPQMGVAWPALPEQGWESERCVYFDALEAIDHHFLLEASDDRTK